MTTDRRPGTALAMSLTRTRKLALLALSAPALLGLPMARAAPVPGTSCDVFPDSNIWNTKVATLPVHPMSETWLESMEAADTNLHPDFGPSSYGLPFDVVGKDHAKVTLRFYYADESDKGTYPFGAGTPIEGGSDRHALIVERGTCKLYEIYDADWNGGDPTGGSGAIFDLDSNKLRPDTWTSADAGGLPIFPGLVRWDEVKAGAIRHAIRFTAELTDASHVWPARHDAGTPNDAYPPMGARFRLKADFDISGFTPRARAILRAMKRYGLILADNGANWFFTGTRDGHWGNKLLDQLKSVPASAFEAVDVSECQVGPNTAKADCP